MVDNLDLQAVRQTLQAEHERLCQHLEEIDERNGRRKSRNPDRTYLAQSYATRERDTALLAMERQQLAQIEAALERLDAGTYGICTSCSEAIAPGRLEALPYATLCVTCQARHK